MLITVFYDAKVRYLFYFVNPPPKNYILLSYNYAAEILFSVLWGIREWGESEERRGGEGDFFLGGNLARGKRLGMEREGIPYGENGTL